MNQFKINDDLSSVCAVVDAQGFIQDGKFVAREVSFSTHERHYNFEVKTGLEYKKMNKEDKNTNKALLKLLGLDLDICPSRTRATLHANQIGKNLKDLYFVFCTKECPNLAVKNHFVKKILKQESIPYIDLDELQYECPALHKLEKLYPSTKDCSKHGISHHDLDFGQGPFRCSYRKTKILMTWIEARIRAHELMCDVSDGDMYY